MKVAFYTLGCKVNTYDTESVWKTFKEKGYERVDFSDFADVYIINTCTVTNNADSKSRKIVRQVIRRNEGAVVVVMGCYAQLASEQIAEIDGVDIVTGTKNRKDIIKYVEEIRENRKQIIKVTAVERRFEELAVDSYSDNTRAFLKIQDGCNEYCSYCIIPFARGPVVSKSLDEVYREAVKLVDNGYKELVLTGIHTGQYGVDIDSSLTELVKKLINIEKLYRIRISSIEINEITDELIELAYTSDKLANHFHIPLQSGEDNVLLDMNRHYTTDEFLTRLDDIRAYNPNIAITTDVIVGFPTETEEAFSKTVEFVQKCEFSELHVFPYSKRNGTVAAKLKDHPNKTKQERVKRLIDVNNQLAKKYVDKFVGEELDFIVEHTSPMTGYTSNYIKVEVAGVEPKNSIVVCEIVNGDYPLSQGIYK